MYGRKSELDITRSELEQAPGSSKNKILTLRVA